MAIISGVFTDPFGAPLANVTISLSARSTTSAAFAGTNAAAVTAADGSYSMSVLVGTYAVTATINRQPDYLGVIQVYPDSPDGTLNEFLACFNPDDATPAILLEMEELVAEAKANAAAAAASAQTAASYALVPRGAYDTDTEYSANDLVEFDGSEYRATADTTGIEPPADPWELFVSAGDQGDKGDAGPANTLMIGEVTTLEPGEPASATITGDAPKQVLNLSIPQGEAGAAGSGVIPDEWDSPGAYVFAYHTVAASDAGRKPGEEVPASDLYVGEIHFEDAAGVKTSGPSYQLHPSGGTWRLQGSMLQGIESTTVQSCLIFLRIDGMTASMQPSAMLLKSTSAESVRNCRYSSADNQMIDCEVEANGKWHPFTASAADVTEWGRAIYAAAVTGVFGDVAEYSE